VVKFEKWQALGNDYLILEERNLPEGLGPSGVRMLCDRHFGVGADGVLLVREVDGSDVVAELKIFNPDGSEAELSGNGAREAALYLVRSGWTEEQEFTIATAAGPIHPRITGERTCSIALGSASTASTDYPSGGDDGLGSLSAGGREWQFRHVSIGNPQCAIEVGADLESLDLAAIGPEVEANRIFPNRTNVSFYRASGSRVRARIFERGVGETLSSGTGATGAAVAAYLSGAQSPLTVELDGGELTVEIGDDLDVVLTGWAEPVFSGDLSDEFMRSLKELARAETRESDE